MTDKPDTRNPHAVAWEVLQVLGERIKAGNAQAGDVEAFERLLDRAQPALEARVKALELQMAKVTGDVSLVRGAVAGRSGKRRLGDGYSPLGADLEDLGSG